MEYHKRCFEGYIYLISSRKRGGIKIGLSSNPNTRLKILKNDYKDKTLAFERINEVSNMLNVEGFLHTHFRSKLIRDEWFDLSPDDILEYDRLILRLKNRFPPGEYSCNG